MNRKRVVIAAGGTGGHIFPAIAVAEQLSRDKIEVIFIGGGLSENLFFQNCPFPFHDIPSSPYNGIRSKSFVPFWQKLFRGVYQSHRLLKRYKPKLVLGFGSYHSIAPLFAAKLRRVPVILHEANAYPGRVNRILSPYVDCVGVHFLDSIPYLKGEVKVVGMPLREGFCQDSMKKQKALHYFELSSEIPVLLISGGSLGSLALNQFVSLALSEAVGKELPEMQIIHFTGKGKEGDKIKTIYKEANVRCVVKDFETRMDYALAAADIAISRAGASSIAEKSEYCLPTIFVPYPGAKDNHQEKNADAYISSSRGGFKINERDLDKRHFIKSLKEMIANRNEIVNNINAYKKIKRQSDLFSLVKEWIDEE